MTPYERKLRRSIRMLTRRWRQLSFMLWNTPVDRHERYLEVSKELVRLMDRAADKARATLKTDL